MEIDQLFTDLLEKAMAATDANLGSVFLVEHEKEQFRIVATAGKKFKPSKGFHLPIKKSLVRSVVYEKMPLLVKDIEKDHATIGNSLTTFTRLRQALIGLPAQLAVIVDKTVFSAPHIFLECTPVGPVHLPVGVIRLHEHAIDNIPDAFVAWRIVRLDLL